MKKFFKKLIAKIREWFVWLTSKRVLDAINNGATYEEVCNIVKEEMSR
jgi:hypothetical protein